MADGSWGTPLGAGVLRRRCSSATPQSTTSSSNASESSLEMRSADGFGTEFCVGPRTEASLRAAVVVLMATGAGQLERGAAAKTFDGLTTTNESERMENVTKLLRMRCFIQGNDDTSASTGYVVCHGRLRDVDGVFVYGGDGGNAVAAFIFFTVNLEISRFMPGRTRLLLKKGAARRRRR